VAVRFIGGGNQSTRRKPLTCRKSQTLSHNVVLVTPRLSGIQTHVSGDRHTECIGSYKFNYHMITALVNFSLWMKLYWKNSFSGFFFISYAKMKACITSILYLYWIFTKPCTFTSISRSFGISVSLMVGINSTRCTIFGMSSHYPVFSTLRNIIMIIHV